MKIFQASTHIHAEAQDIWTILMDASRYHEWDPTCERIEGTIEKGKTIKAYSTLSPGKAFPVKVAELNAPQTMVWSAGMPLGLFKGERTFQLTPHPDGGTTIEVKEVFTGLLLGLIGSKLPDLTEPFELFVRGLKQRAEST